MLGLFMSGRLGRELARAGTEASDDNGPADRIRRSERRGARHLRRHQETRGTDWINNFWKALAHDPPTLRRTWESIKEVMMPGALDPLTKELVYLAVSVSNGCAYCTASHAAAAKKQGMSPQMLAELMAVVGMANETNTLPTAIACR